MKNLALLLALIFSLDNAFGGFPPTTLKGQAGTKATTFNFEVPNNQATTTTTGSLIDDCGEPSNLLANCGAEHTTYDSSWVFTGTTATKTKETTKIFDGVNSVKFVASSQIVAMAQNSTLYVNAYADGAQGVATAMVWSSSADIYLCANDTAGAIVSASDGIKITNCVRHSGGSRWEPLELPVILGGTSNGFGIYSLNATTGALANTSGTVYVDKLTLSTKKITSPIQNRGEWTDFTSIVAGLGTGSATTYGKIRQVGDSAEIWIRLQKDASAGSGSTAVSLTIPSNLTLDSVKVPSGSAVSGKMWSTDATLSLSNLSSYLDTSDSKIRLLVGHATMAGSAVPASSTFDIFLSAPITQYRGPNASTSVYTTTSNNVGDIGTVVYTANTTAPDNYISTDNKSIGNVGSGATYTGNDYYALYEVLWNTSGLSTTAGNPFVISSAKGASASADFAANKKITVDLTTTAPFLRPKTSAKNLGEYTSDTMQGHWHDIAPLNNLSNRLVFNQLAAGSGGSSIAQGGSAASTDRATALGPITDGTNGTPRTGAETAPKYVSLNAWIKYRSNNVIVGSFSEVPTTRGSNGADIQSVSFGATGSADCSAVCTTGVCNICNRVGNKITSISFFTTAAYDVNGISGTKYNCTGQGIDSVTGKATALLHNIANSTSSFSRIQTNSGNVGVASITCVGIP